MKLNPHKEKMSVFGVKFLYEHTLMNKILCKGKIHNVN